MPETDDHGCSRTDLPPRRLPNGAFEPNSMVDYYLALSQFLGAESPDHMPELAVSPEDEAALKDKLACVTDTVGPLVILVPGGAFFRVHAPWASDTR